MYNDLLPHRKALFGWGYSMSWNGDLGDLNRINMKYGAAQTNMSCDGCKQNLLTSLFNKVDQWEKSNNITHGS